MTTTRRRTTRAVRTLRRQARGMARAWLHAYAHAYAHAFDDTAGLSRVSPGLGLTAPIRVPPTS